MVVIRYMLDLLSSRSLTDSIVAVVWWEATTRPQLIGALRGSLDDGRGMVVCGGEQR